MNFPGLPRLIPRPCEAPQPGTGAAVHVQDALPVLSVPVVPFNRIRNQRKAILPRKRLKVGTSKAKKLDSNIEGDLPGEQIKRNKRVEVCWPKPTGEDSENSLGSVQNTNSSALREMPWIKEHKFKCGICNKHYNSKQVLKRHLNMHRGIYSYTCTICGKGYTSRSNLRGHVASQHTKVKEFKCSFCGTEFTTKYWLKDHLKVKHNTTLEHIEEMEPANASSPQNAERPNIP